ncbi:MAG: AMP-binding protein [Actinomycetota bacterium]|nr:AMP-binding protein [Actinomycetota bacterium]MDA3028607.1 AMP-binding protein [Actinomycetota bacterium]
MHGQVVASRVSSTITSLLGRAYEMYADRPAVTGADGAVVSFDELRSRSLQLVAGLHRLGVERDDRVIMMMKNRRESFEIEHACFNGGFLRVGLSYRLHPQEIVGIAKDCDARAIFVDEEAGPATLQAIKSAGLDIRTITFDGLDGTPAYLELFSGDEATPIAPDPEDIAWLPYTSGTTGQPKGVMISHRTLVACVRNLMVELPPITEHDRLLHVAPLTHLSGWVGLACILRGASHLPMASFDATRTLETIEQRGITLLPMVPTMINAMLPIAEGGSYDVSSVHTILYGGSAIAPDRLARAVKVFGEVFLQGYGLTEVPFPLTSLSKDAHRFDHDQPAPERLASAGRVTPFVEVRLVTPDGTDAAEGELGEIWARGDITMSGYWNLPDETAAMIDADGWAATGDVGKMVDGFMYIVDRKKDMIVSGGFNIFPREVENAILALEGVDEVAVIGVPHEKWGEAVQAVVVRRDGFETTESDVIEACRSRIASYKKPQSVKFVDELPKTGSGKVMHRQLRDAAWAGHSRKVAG